MRGGLVVVLVAIMESRAWAAGPLGPRGSRIQTSDYGVDLHQGPVLAGSRITALGGAYTAVAEGTEGIQYNPAAVSLRPSYSTTRDDYDLTAGLTLPASVRGNDFDNNGRVGFAYDDFYWLTFGGLVQHDKLGFGVLVSFQNYALGGAGESGNPVAIPDSSEVIDSVTIRLFRVDPVVSYGFLDEQLHVGAGLRIVSFFGIGDTRVTAQDVTSERILINSNGAGAQAGVLWAPRAQSLRVGAAVRSPTAAFEGDPGRIAANADGDRVVGNLYLPNKIALPWEVEGGISVQLWKRPLNLPWTDEDTVAQEDAERWRRTNHDQIEPPSRGARRLLGARERELPRERVLLSVSSLISGPVKDAVGVESMLTRETERSGEHAVVSLRAGAEAEVVPYWLVLRAGSYLEPTRFASGSPRVHGTGGFAVRLFRSSVFGLFDDGTVFRVSAAADASRDYFGWSVGAGIFR